MRSSIVACFSPLLLGRDVVLVVDVDFVGFPPEVAVIEHPLQSVGRACREVWVPPAN